MAAIISLLFRCSPTAIPRLVISIVINPIKCHSFWSWPHIFQKCFKGKSPRQANIYSASCMTWTGCLILWITSLQHCSPTYISRTSFPNSVPMSALENGVRGFEPCRTQFVFPTTTRNVNAVLSSEKKPALNHFNFFRASALTFPKAFGFSFAVASFRLFNNEKSSKSLSGEIYSFWHSIGNVFAVSGGRVTNAHHSILSNLATSVNSFGLATSAQAIESSHGSSGIRPVGYF